MAVPPTIAFLMLFAGLLAVAALAASMVAARFAVPSLINTAIAVRDNALQRGVDLTASDDQYGEWVADIERPGWQTGASTDRTSSLHAPSLDDDHADVRHRSSI